MKTIAEVEKEIAYAVAEKYLQTGDPSSVQDIASHIGCSLATAYRTLHRTNGMITGIMAYDEIGTPGSRPMLPNAQKLGPYYPAPYFLRELILDGRILTRSDNRERADLEIVRNGQGGYSDKTNSGTTPQTTKEGNT